MSLHALRFAFYFSSFFSALSFWLVIAAVPSVAVAAPTISTLEAQLKASPRNIKIREALGSTYVKHKRHAKAVEVLAPYANEISSDGLIDLAAAYASTKDSMNELRVLQLFAEKEPERFRPHFLLGEAYRRNKKLDEAAKSLRQAIAYAPKHRPSYDILLEIFNETKQNYESRTLVNEMIRTFGEKKEFFNHLCRLYAIDSFLQEALATCQKAISKNPKFPDNHIYLAQTYYNQDNKVAAERIFRTAGRQFPRSEFVQYASGEYYLNEKNYPTAVRYLEAAVALNAASRRSQLTLALALYENRNYAKALTHFVKSCTLDKSNETVTLLKNATSRLRQMNESTMGDKYDSKAATCQSF